MAKLSVEIYDGNGNKVDEVPMGQNGITGEEVNGKFQEVYQATGEDGKTYYTSTMPESSGAITLDKETGNINISAPQSLLDDPSFNEIFDKNILEQFSSAYKRNKNFKLPDPFDEGDESKDITIPELVEKYDDQIKNFIKAFNEEKESRKEISEGKAGFSNRNDIANRLTRNDFITMSTNALGEGANDDALISIPKSMYEDVNFLESFDSEAGTVKKGEFYDKVFSLVDKDEEYINSLYNRLEEYFEENDFEDTDEYARATALYSFILKNDPEKTPIQEANYVTSSFFKGLGIGLSEFGKSIETLLSGGDEEYIAKAYESQTKYREESEEFLSRMSTAGKTALNVGAFGGEIGTDIVAAIATGGVAAELASVGVLAKAGRIAGIIDKAGTVTEDAAKVAKVASSIDDITSMTETAATLAATAEDLSIGADVLMAASTASEAAQLASKAATALNVASKTYTATDIIAQSVVEAALTDPVVMGKVLQGQERDGTQAGVYEDAYGELLETAAWNVAGWGLFTVGAKGVKYFGGTKAGRYTNAVAQKYLNKVSTATGSIGEKLLKVRYGEDWLEGSRSAQKNEARMYNYNLRQGQKSVANQKIGMPFSKEAWRNVQKQEDNIIDLMNLHNATDAMQRGAKAYIRRTLNAIVNPKLSGYEQKLRALGAEITRAERRAGLSTRRRIFRVKDNQVVRVFSKESANYIGARTQLDILENIKRIRGGLTDAQQKSEEILQRMLEQSKAKLPKEIQDYLEEYLEWDRKFWQEYNNLRMVEGSLSTRQIEELRAEGYWGENGELYRPSYRVDPNRKTKLVRNDDRIARDNDTATEQYVWGSDKDFMDPELARYVAMGDAGTTLNSARYIEAIAAIPSTKAHVVHDAEEVARAQRMKDIRIPLNARIKSATKGVFQSGKISTGESAKRATRLYTMRANWVKQAGKTEEAELALARASTKKIKPTVTEKRSAVGAMTQAQLDDVFTEAGVTLDFSRMRSQDEFEAFYNSLDKTTQKYVQQKMGNVAGILYPAETESALERVITKNKLSETDGVSVEKIPQPLVKNAPYITAENYNKLARLDSSFVPGLKKSLAQNRIDLRDSAVVTKAAEEARRAKLISEREGLYKENFAELNRLSKEGLKIKDEDAILAEFDLGINEYLEEIYSDKKLAQTIDDIIEQSGTVDKEAAREYIVLEEMLRDEGQEFREIRQVARDELKGNPKEEKISDTFEKMFEDKIYDRRNIARQKLVDEGSTLVDRKSWMEEIRKADQEITGKLSEPGYVSVPNARGEMEIWEVDPVAADLYKYAARQPDMGKAAKFFNETSKIFRLNTTGLNIMSYVNQSFRDFGNLWLTSGSYHTIRLSRAEMIDMFGPEIANWYLREEPEVYAQLIKMAERQGKPIESLVVERELAMGREISTQATETALLKTVGDAGKMAKIKNGELSRSSQWIDRAVDKLSTPNEWRERVFRNIVYADSLDQALKRGYTLKSARIQAEFMMNNATTNFSRELVHLQWLQRTVPYIGAAVNGTKSFFRILSVDPVGVMSRFVGGFIIPVMAFTGLALADPEARKKYEQLNEYEKDNNIIINVNGSLMKIPIPQEVGSLVKPWQHLVEKMWDSNRHDFWELMLNDALGISPMDITGFYDLDQDAMENPTIWDRLGNGAAQLVWGQMSPPPVKAAYMLVTGTDPYTGKFIDTSYQYYDYESGEVLVMDSSQSAFSQVMAKVFGGSAGVLAATLNAVLGRTGLDVLDAVTTAAQYAASDGEEGSLTTIFEQIGESISKPITVADYDRTKTAWNREISKLYREKESIQNNPRFKELEDAINVETDPQKLKSLKADRADMLEDWYEEIKVAINKFQDNFGGTIDRFRMASLLSLLNMYESTGGLGAPGRAANDDLFNEGRSEAIRTLIDMGVSATGDRSILGYMTNVRHKDGTESTEVKFYKPLEILAMQNAWYDKANVNVSYIEELLEDGAINYKDKLKQVKKLRQQIFDKGKLSQADRSDISALELNWNAEVMQVLAPYFERVTPESAINDEKVMEYLDDFILIPSEFKKDKRGRYVTNKYLGEGSANDAYIKNYIRKIFEINDTGYSTGKNYSGRQSLGG